MKKILFSISALLLFFVSASAKLISSDEAAVYAKKFFNSSSVSLSSTGTDSGFATYYVFENAAGGWVMISAEDSSVPVIGYNRTGKFSKKVPANLKFRLDGYGKEITAIRKKGISQNSAVRLQWENVGLGTKAGTVKTLETALWNQSEPFNDLCPTAKGESDKAVTGCVATAMAIVLRYNQWPANGKGSLPSYKFKYSSQPDSTLVQGYSIQDASGKRYDYSIMPTTDGTGWTPAQRKAVATLMHDCGVMVKMSYSYNGSGAFSEDITPALAKYMYYSASARFLYRSSFNQVDWFRMVKAEIDANRPIIYGGQDSGGSGGHQFVIDGYDTDGFVHVNWGWGGIGNGSYMLNSLGGPSIGGIFNLYDNAIFGLTKDEKGTDEENADFLFLRYSMQGQDFDGLTLTSGSMEKGQSFNLSVGCIYNIGNDNKANIKLCVLDKENNVKYDLTMAEELELQSGYLSGFSWEKLTLTEDPAIGDHISLFYQLKNNEWVILGNTGDAYKAAYQTQNCIGVIDCPMLFVKDSYKAGEVFFFNNVINGQKPVLYTSYFFDGTAIKDSNVKLTKGTHTAKVVLTFIDKTTATIEQTVKVN